MALLVLANQVNAPCFFKQMMLEDYQFEGVGIEIQPILTLLARGQFSSHSQYSDICNYLCMTLQKNY